jgi:hypothetical protein
MKAAEDAANRLKTHPDIRAQKFIDCFIDIFRKECEDIERNAFYIASFSRARDDLGQWRAYADNGRGFAIGFAPYLFTCGGPPDGPSLARGAVSYKSGEVDALYMLPIMAATQIFVSEATTNRDLIIDKTIGIPFIEELVRALIPMFIWRTVTTKHPAYEHEREVRLVILAAATKLSGYVKTRCRGNETVPYIPQPWSLRESGNVVEIIIGPAGPPGAERTLREFLGSLGMDFVHIGRSDIPYRAL